MSADPDSGAPEELSMRAPKEVFLYHTRAETREAEADVASRGAEALLQRCRQVLLTDDVHTTVYAQLMDDIDDALTPVPE